MFALDTNTVIFFFKGQGNIQKHLFSQAPNELFIPSVVVYELEHGILRASESKQKKMQFQTFCEHCKVISFGLKEAENAAGIKYDLEKKGCIIGPMDILIAACALANNLTLITHNTKEFRRVRHLKIEDWY